MKLNKVASNAFWIVFCKLIKAILVLIITSLTARYLGPSNYGLISYAASLTTFVAPIMKLGLDSTMVYEIINNKDKEGEVIGTSIIMCLISGLFCLIGIICFVFFVNTGESNTLIVASLYGLLLIFQALEMIQYWFQAKLLSKYSSIVMLISYVIIALFQFLLLITKQNVYWFALSHSLDYLIISVALIMIYLKKSKYKLSFSLPLVKTLFNNSKYYIISSLMVSIFAQTDRIMIKLFMSNEHVGYYSAALTCATMFGFVFAAIIDSIRPIAYEKKKLSNQKFEQSITEMYSIIIYFSLFVSLIMTIFSPIIIEIMYGKDYGNSIEILRLIVWFSTFSYLGTIRNIWITAEGKQKYLWIINLSGAILNIILNYILIPVYGTMGAAFASLVTQIFTNVIIGFIIKPIKNNNILMLKSLDIRLLKPIVKGIVERKKKKYEK